MQSSKELGMPDRTDVQKATVEQNGAKITIEISRLGVDLEEILILFQQALWGVGYILPDPVCYHLDWIDESREDDLKEKIT